MIQLLAASTLYQVASLAAMIDAGAVPPADRRVLVLANGSQQPELTTPIDQAAGFELLRTRFDDVVDLGALIWPRRPNAFSPREDELTMWQQLLRSHWGLGQNSIHLYLESLQVNPAVALARIFHDALVSVHSDGLMSYGPSRNTIKPSIAQRLEQLLYIDIVPGLRPVLMREHGIALVPVAGQALARVFEHIAEHTVSSPPTADLIASGRSTALILGQYLVPLGVLTSEEQDELDQGMLLAALRSGATTVAYKPHPSAGSASLGRLREDALEMGLDFVSIEDDVPAEVLMVTLRPLTVISGFSTSLITARELFALRAEPVGLELIGPRLKPYENSNRVPLVLADAVLAQGVAAGQPHLQGLIDSIAYCMQPQRLPDLRATAEDFLAREPELRDRYVKQRRLRALGLPAAPRSPQTAAGFRPRAVARRLLENRLGPEGAQRTIAQLYRARATPRRAVGKLGNTLVTWSKAR